MGSLRESFMKIALATVALTLWFATTASAQEACLVGQRGLSFQQWYQICAQQVAQTCSVLPMQPAACAQSVAAAEYQTYRSSQNVSMACQVPGQAACINGYVATCNGTLFITSARRC
jgi:hypothetical protein